ncbi:MAG: hypothetical protein QNJ97_28580 [Myxococcota bacterium]|nr:hypothetical protein [Myxococcota bacterium]
MLRGPISPADWYPMQPALVDPTRAVCDMFYEGSVRGAVEQGRFSATIGLKGIFRLFVRLSAPELIISRASEILPTYYRPSKLHVAETGPGYAKIHITEFPEPDMLVENRILGWMRQALLICGVASEKGSIAESMTSGSSVTKIHLSWI